MEINNKNEIVTDKFEIRIGYYKDIYNGEKRSFNKRADEVFGIDLFTTVINRESIEPVLRDRANQVVQALLNKLEDDKKPLF